MDFHLYYFLHIHKVSGRNIKIFHVKMLNNEETMPFLHYLVVRHCNANDSELGEAFNFPLMILIS